MNAESRTAKSIFMASLRIERGAKRDAYINQACQNSETLRRRVRTLLTAHEANDSFLETPVLLMDEDCHETKPDLIGQQVGQYSLLSEIGEGGFGTVYRAEQRHPIRRTVALKLVKVGMDTQQLIARFETERQALAMMDHPNIAKVFDAGTTNSGDPFFAMELVEGTPITSFCDDHFYSVSQRLKLFVDVCHAVHHAHQKGIIHRDIKPGNVLVEDRDSKPIAKVIDFGIAKSLDYQLTDNVSATSRLQLVGTPQYMSPEQADSSRQGVDTRSDVYSLGGLLYELLTGKEPIDTERVSVAGLVQLGQLICSGEITPPFMRFSASTGEEQSELAARRQTQPPALRRTLRGDLDWIVMRALAKDRERRYQSANELSADVERYLRSEPVSAGPPSIVYRAKKAAKRHRMWFTAALTLLLSMTVGLILATTGFHVARQRARESRHLLQLADMTTALQAWQQGDVKRLFRKVERLRESEVSTRPERFLWEHLSALVQQTNAIPTIRHEHVVESVVFIRNGGSIATGAEDGSITIWDVATGRLQQRLAGHAKAVHSLSLSPDGRLLASGSGDHMIKLWDANNGKLRDTFDTRAGPVLSLDFSSDGRRLAGAMANGHFQIWELRTRSQLFSIRAHQGWARCLDYAPNSDTVATVGGDGLVKLWDVDTQRELAAIAADKATLLWSLSFSPDGEKLAVAGWDEAAKVWDVSDLTRPNLICLLEDTKASIRSLQFSRDGRTLIGAGWDKNVKLWDPLTGKRIAVYRGHRGHVFDLSLSPSGVQLATASVDQSVKLWDVSREIQRMDRVSANGHAACLAFSPDSTRLAYGIDQRNSGHLTIWDVRRAELLDTIDDSQPIRQVAFSPLGQTLAYSTGSDSPLSSAAKGDVHLVSLPTGAARILKGHQRVVYGLAFSSHGTLLGSASPEGLVRLWDVREGKQLHAFEGHSRAQTVAFSPTQSILASGGGQLDMRGELIIWDLKSYERVDTIDQFAEQVMALEFSHNGRQIAIGSGDGTVRLYDVVTGQLTELGAHTHMVLSLAFASDRMTLASASPNGVIRLWDIATGLTLGTLDGPVGLYQIAFSPNGQILAAANTDGSVKLWRTRLDQQSPWAVMVIDATRETHSDQQTD